MTPSDSCVETVLETLLLHIFIVIKCLSGRLFDLCQGLLHPQNCSKLLSVVILLLEINIMHLIIYGLHFSLCVFFFS